MGEPALDPVDSEAFRWPTVMVALLGLAMLAVALVARPLKASAVAAFGHVALLGPPDARRWGGRLHLGATSRSSASTRSRRTVRRRSGGRGRWWWPSLRWGVGREQLHDRYVERGWFWR